MTKLLTEAGFYPAVTPRNKGDGAMIETCAFCGEGKDAVETTSVRWQCRDCEQWNNRQDFDPDILIITIWDIVTAYKMGRGLDGAIQDAYALVSEMQGEP